MNMNTYQDATQLENFLTSEEEGDDDALNFDISPENILITPNDDEQFDNTKISVNSIIEEEEETTIPAPDVTSAFKLKDAPIIAIPTANLNDLFKSSGVINVAIHDVVLSLDKGSLEKLGVDTENQHMIDMVVEALTEKITPEEALELRRNQQIAVRNGIQFVIEGTEVIKSTANFTVLVPELCSQIKIETLNKEIEKEKNLTLLNEVKPEFISEARGLNRILKNSAAAELLNYIQTLNSNEELNFYLDVLSRFPKDSATVVFSLSLMRHVMQYSFNCDNLILKAILTEVLDKDE